MNNINLKYSTDEELSNASLNAISGYKNALQAFPKPYNSSQKKMWINTIVRWTHTENEYTAEKQRRETLPSEGTSIQSQHLGNILEFLDSHSYTAIAIYGFLIFTSISLILKIFGKL
jgi:hypothetical protein